MKKKMAALVITVSMVMSLCTGCSGKEESASADDNGTEEIVYWNIGTENPDKDILDRKSTRLNSSHSAKSRMPSSA